MIISDSNGKHFDPKRHHEKKVVMEHQYTRKIPERENPDFVTDIVFMTGLNNRGSNGMWNVEEIVSRQKDDCHEFHHKFKKAKFHIVAVPPETQKQRNLNKRLSEYASSAGISYVDNDDLIDKQTGEVKEGMMKRSHYTPLATSIIAGHLKRSLYSHKPLQQQQKHPLLYPLHQQQQRHHQQQGQQQQQLPIPQRQQFLQRPQFHLLPQLSNQWNFLPTNPWQPQNQPLPPTTIPSPT